MAVGDILSACGRYLCQAALLIYYILYFLIKGDRTPRIRSLDRKEAERVAAEVLLKDIPTASYQVSQPASYHSVAGWQPNQNSSPVVQVRAYQSRPDSPSFCLQTNYRYSKCISQSLPKDRKQIFSGNRVQRLSPRTAAFKTSWTDCEQRNAVSDVEQSDHSRRPRRRAGFAETYARSVSPDNSLIHPSPSNQNDQQQRRYLSTSIHAQPAAAAVAASLAQCKNALDAVVNSYNSLPRNLAAHSPDGGQAGQNNFPADNLVWSSSKRVRPTFAGRDGYISYTDTADSRPTTVQADQWQQVYERRTHSTTPAQTKLYTSSLQQADRQPHSTWVAPDVAAGTVKSLARAFEMADQGISDGRTARQHSHRHWPQGSRIMSSSWTAGQPSVQTHWSAAQHAAADAPVAGTPRHHRQQEAAPLDTDFYSSTFASAHGMAVQPAKAASPAKISHPNFEMLFRQYGDLAAKMITPELNKSLWDDASGRGAEMFARQKEHSAKYVIDETNVRKPTPAPPQQHPVAYKQRMQQKSLEERYADVERWLQNQRRIELVKSPWEATLCAGDPYSAFQTVSDRDKSLAAQGRKPISLATSQPNGYHLHLGAQAAAGASQLKDRYSVFGVREISVPRGWRSTSSERGADLLRDCGAPAASGRPAKLRNWRAFSEEYDHNSDYL